MLAERLAAFSFVRPLSVAARSELAARLQLRRVAAGTQVSARGQAARSVFLVFEGEFLGGIAARGGREVLLDVLGPGAVFGELAALDGGARVRSVRATRDGEVAVVAARDFTAWLDAHPRAMRAVLSELASQQRLLADRLYELAMHDVETRVRLHLLRDFIAAGQLEPGGRLEGAPDTVRIASFVGASPAEVADAVGRFEAAGLCRRDAEALVLSDPMGLEHGLRKSAV